MLHSLEQEEMRYDEFTGSCDCWPGPELRTFDVYYLLKIPPMTV